VSNAKVSEVREIVNLEESGKPVFEAEKLFLWGMRSAAQDGPDTSVWSCRGVALSRQLGRPPVPHSRHSKPLLLNPIFRIGASFCKTERGE
jgi:hypothetical protein